MIKPNVNPANFICAVVTFACQGFNHGETTYILDTRYKADMVTWLGPILMRSVQIQFVQF